ncbi:unnamed protein product [Meloidogyne enterolobii]|uniref:Uncharacterized protein n=1 Tax=Meloidogyne enterolobii TaxID=390850 RepID=A0ACB0Z739_MELEN
MPIGAYKDIRPYIGLVPFVTVLFARKAGFLRSLINFFRTYGGGRGNGTMPFIFIQIKPQSLDKIVIFVDQLVDSKGETLINVGNNTEFYRDYLDLAIKGSSKNIQKIAKAVDALIDDKKYFYYLNGKCRDIKSEGNSIGLKLKNSNTTLNFSKGYSRGWCK